MKRLGRRKGLMFGSLIGAVGCLLTAIFNLPIILFGRVLFGIAVGINGAIGARYTEETVPAHLYEVYSPFNMIYYTLGVVLAFSLGFIIPQNNDKKALMADKRWRIIYVYVPLAIFFIQYLGLIFIAKYDGIKYLIRTKNDLSEAKLAI